MDARLRYDLYERHSSAVVVHASEGRKVFEHPCVVFEVYAVDSERMFYSVNFCHDCAAYYDRLVVLRDLEVAGLSG